MIVIKLHRFINCIWNAISCWLKKKILYQETQGRHPSEAKGAPTDAMSVRYSRLKGKLWPTMTAQQKCRCKYWNFQAHHLFPFHAFVIMNLDKWCRLYEYSLACDWVQCLLTHQATCISNADRMGLKSGLFTRIIVGSHFKYTTQNVNLIKRISDIDATNIYKACWLAWLKGLTSARCAQS